LTHLFSDKLIHPFHYNLDFACVTMRFIN